MFQVLPIKSLVMVLKLDRQDNLNLLLITITRNEALKTGNDKDKGTPEKPGTGKINRKANIPPPITVPAITITPQNASAFFQLDQS